LTAALVLGGLPKLEASGAQTRIVRYLYDGDGVKKAITITSFRGGSAIATLSVQSNTGKNEVTSEISAETFAKIWSGFDALSELKRSEITSSATSVDTETHHVIYRLEKGASASTSKWYGVRAADAGPEFRAWLHLIEPEKKTEANQRVQTTAMTPPPSTTPVAPLSDP
jgi:hypothetical protein